MARYAYATPLDARIAHARNVAAAAARRAIRSAAANPTPRVLTAAQRDAHAWMRASDVGRVVYLLVADQCVQHARLAAAACLYRLDPAEPPYTRYVCTVGANGLRRFDPPEPLPLPGGLHPACPHCQASSLLPAQPARATSRLRAAPPVVLPLPVAGSPLLRYGLGALVDWDNTAPADPYAPAPRRGDVPAHANVELLLAAPSVDSQPGETPWPLAWMCARHAARGRRQAAQQRRADYAALGFSDTRRERLRQYRQHLLTTAYVPPGLVERATAAWAREDAGDAQVLALVDRFRGYTAPAGAACHLHAGCAAVLDALAAEGSDVYAQPDDIAASRDMLG